MRVHHRGAHIRVTEQLRPRADVIPVLQKVRGQRMAQRVTRRARRPPGAVTQISRVQRSHTFHMLHMRVARNA